MKYREFFRRISAQIRLQKPNPLAEIRAHLVALGLPEAAGWTDEETEARTRLMLERTRRAFRALAVTAKEASEAFARASASCRRMNIQGEATVECGGNVQMLRDAKRFGAMSCDNEVIR